MAKVVVPLMQTKLDNKVREQSPRKIKARWKLLPVTANNRQFIILTTADHVIIIMAHQDLKFIIRPLIGR